MVMRCVALMLLLGAGSAINGVSAQTVKTPPSSKSSTTAAPVSADPGTTSASYGDWVVRCQRVGEGDKAQRVCEVAQTIQAQNQRDPIAEIAFGHLPHEPALHLTTVLPPSVSFPSSVQFASDEKGADAIQLPWRRCLPGGCFADVSPSDDAVKAWRAAAGPGRMTFKDATGHDVALPVSFRGLAQALDALPKS